MLFKVWAFLWKMVSDPGEWTRLLNGTDYKPSWFTSHQRHGLPDRLQDQLCRFPHRLHGWISRSPAIQNVHRRE